MPIPRRNNWSNTAADLEDAQLQTANQVRQVAVMIGSLIESQPDAGILVDRVDSITRSAEILAAATAAGFEAVSERMGQATDAILASATQIDLVAAELARTANSVHAIARQVEGHDATLCTALYHATVNDLGEIDYDTQLGKYLPRDQIERLDQRAFIDAVLAAFRADKNPPGGLKEFMNPDVLGCFYDRLKGVPGALKRINSSKSKKK